MPSPAIMSPLTTMSVAPQVTPSAPVPQMSVSPGAPTAPQISVAPRPTPVAPPAVVTAKPAVQNVQKQTAAVAEKTTAAQTQQQQTAAALAAKNAADAARAATGGLTPEQSAAKVKEMQASVLAQSSQAAPKTNADGKLISYDGGASYVPNPATTGSTPTPSPTTPTSASSTVPPPQTDVPQTPEQKARASLDASDLKLQTAYDDHKNKIDQIINGTYPLTEDQKSQLNNISTQFTSLINSQKLANANYEQSLRVAGISSGRSMYAPEIELGNIKGAMDEGVAKIADIDMKMQSTLLLAREAIKNDNIKMLDSAYNDLMNFESQKRKSITDLYNISTKEIDNAKQTYKAAQEEAESYASLSKDPSTFSPDFFSKMDKQREQVGLPTYEGYSKDIYKLQYDESAEKKKQADSAAEMKRATDLFTILDKTGGTGVVKVGDHTYTYQGRNAANFASGTETDASGKMVAWERNLTTGQVKTFDLGITKPEEGWSTQKMNDGTFWAINAKTGESKPIYASDGRKTWDYGEYKTGEIGPALPGSKNAGQCGAMNNYFYGKGVVGDSLQSKLDPLRPYAVKNVEDIQPGMTFVQNIGSNGHIGFVESVGTDPTNGKKFITAFESNYGLDGRISHGRKIYLDDDTLKMISNYPTSKLPKVGPGATPQALRDSPESEKPLSASEIKSYRDMGYEVTPGMTLADVQGQKPAKDVTETSFEDFRKGMEQESGMSLPLSTVQAAYKAEVESLKPIKQAIGVIAATAPSVAAGKQMVSSVTEALERGDTEGVKQLLKASAITSLPTAEQTKVRGREVGIQTLNNIEKLLNDYKAAGGETGLVSGTEAEMLEKIGRIKDQQKKSIATQIRSALIDYRSAVSGAAFTESEMQEYKGLFPSISSSYDLNLAKIDGLKRAWRQGNDATFRTIMTPSLYDSIYN